MDGSRSRGAEQRPAHFLLTQIKGHFRCLTEGEVECIQQYDQSMPAIETDPIIMTERKPGRRRDLPIGSSYCMALCELTILRLIRLKSADEMQKL